jgi:multiple sugar transport system permease protein
MLEQKQSDVIQVEQPIFIPITTAKLSKNQIPNKQKPKSHSDRGLVFWKKIGHRLEPYLLILPLIFSILLWIYRPLIQTFELAFYEWNLIRTSPKTFVGLDNFSRILSLPEFRVAVVNTLIYIVGVLPFSVIVPLYVAIVTDGLKKRLRNFYRAVIFLPMLMAPVTVAAVWRWILHPTNGILNRVLVQNLGFSEPIRFFTNPNLVIWTIIFLTGWKLIGFSTIFYAAGLTGINRDYYEAASIAGANRWQKIRYITLPLLSPQILFLTMISILFSAQWTFAYINVLTQGGPMGRSTNIYYLLYLYGFQSFSAGWSAASSVLFFISFAILAIGFLFLNKRLSFHDE